MLTACGMNVAFFLLDVTVCFIVTALVAETAEFLIARSVLAAKVVLTLTILLFFESAAIILGMADLAAESTLGVAIVLGMASSLASTTERLRLIGCRRGVSVVSVISVALIISTHIYDGETFEFGSTL